MSQSKISEDIQALALEILPMAADPPPAYLAGYVRTDGLGYEHTDVFVWHDRAMVTIPQSLIEAETVQALEDWLLFSPAWCQPNGKVFLEAANAWRRERFVRRNVRRATFLQWRAENPRYFVTPRERRYLEYLRAKSDGPGPGVQSKAVLSNHEEASRKG